MVLLYLACRGFLLTKSDYTSREFEIINELLIGYVLNHLRRASGDLENHLSLHSMHIKVNAARLRAIQVLNKFVGADHKGKSIWDMEITDTQHGDTTQQSNPGQNGNSTQQRTGKSASATGHWTSGIRPLDVDTSVVHRQDTGRALLENFPVATYMPTRRPKPTIQESDDRNTTHLMSPDLQSEKSDPGCNDQLEFPRLPNDILRP